MPGADKRTMNARVGIGGTWRHADAAGSAAPGMLENKPFSHRDLARLITHRGPAAGGR
jgi:hypothetical protein